MDTQHSIDHWHYIDIEVRMSAEVGTRWTFDDGCFLVLEEARVPHCSTCSCAVKPTRKIVWGKPELVS